jgi:hypothetical protein
MDNRPSPGSPNRSERPIFTSHSTTMLRFVSALLLLATLGCGHVSAQAATESKPTALMTDLCGCMSAIDLQGSDRAVEFGVRSCLEKAVVEHPAEVRAILQRRPGTGSKAFQLGTALGGALQRMCHPFRAVRERLNRMPIAAGSKQGT